MDYKTIPISREDIRMIGKVIRTAFDVPLTGAFPVLEVLDKIKYKFPKCDYIIKEDDCFDLTEMGRCVPNEIDGWNIEIKESVYLGAYKRRIGAYKGFIAHEIAHLFLVNLGYGPLFEKRFENCTIERCRSMEWQASALAGELMIPYEESKGMDKETIIEKYNVSAGMAEFRLKLDKKKRHIN